MIIFDVNLKKYEIFWMLQISLELQSRLCYEPCKLKNVIHSSLFRKIFIETQCIECINDHFYANLKRYELFWMLRITFEFQSWHCSDTFTLKNVVHSSLFWKIVIETQCIDCINDHIWCQFEKICNFLNASTFFRISIMALLWTF